jgi:hypothetical protein
MAFRNRRLNKSEITVDSSEEIGVQGKLLEGVDGLEAGSLFYLN